MLYLELKKKVKIFANYRPSKDLELCILNMVYLCLCRMHI